jgi:hypothetical protein
MTQITAYALSSVHSLVNVVIGGLITRSDMDGSLHKSRHARYHQTDQLQHELG